ncbi:MATE family efflux transporter [Atopobium fossor]|uniref:MATE family efflux transporter n=1 Tax=Atopobium fossor TaxID=39487 RepID=UPI0003F6EA0A|nr:MATE family efflux transporter [Atopobium fossor]
MQSNHEKLFTQTPLLKMLLIIVVPGAISMLTSALYDIIDGILVGNILGETAFAAINLAMPYVIILFSIGDLIGVGSAVPISIKLGEKDHEAANNIFSYSVVMLFVGGIGMGLLMFFAAPLLISLQGATGELARISIIYLRIYALFIPVSGMMFAIDNYLKVCGKVNRSMGLNILMAVSGAIIEAILLIVFHLDVWAAALAYSLAMVIASVIGLWPFIRNKMVLSFVRPRPTVTITKQIVMAGFSAFLNNIAGRIVSIVLNARILALGGTQAISIFGIMMFTNSFVVALIYGTTDSLQPAIGYNWGAQNYKHAFDIGKSSFIVSAIFSLSYVVLLHFFPEFAVRIFIFNASDDFVVAATSAFDLLSLQWLTRWFVLACDAFLLACGQSNRAVWLSVASSIALPLATIVLLSPLGLTGVWLTSAISDGISALFGAWLLIDFLHKHGYKAKKKAIHE